MPRVLAVLLLALVGCRAPAAPDPPSPAAARRAQLTERSAVDPQRAEVMHALLSAARETDVAPVYARASARLREAMPREALAASLRRLVSAFGPPLGILEEHVHTEGASRWYSGLVVHGNPDGGGVLTPVLFQFSLDTAGHTDTLLIREHWFVDELEHPAEAYLPVTRFHLPARGTWYVLHGGRARATNYHHGNTHQRWAYDLVIKRDGRQRPRGSERHRNESFYAHGEDLLAPAAGTVIHVVDGVPENVPPERGRAGGNGLIIDHGFGEYSAMWHAIPGSLEVEVGDRVQTGQRVARVGNSGRSTGPHIHWHVSHRRPGTIEERFGLPADITDVYVDGVWHAHKMPVRGQYVRPGSEAIRIQPIARAPTVFIDR